MIHGSDLAKRSGPLTYCYLVEVCTVRNRVSATLTSHFQHVGLLAVAVSRIDWDFEGRGEFQLDPTQWGRQTPLPHSVTADKSNTAQRMPIKSAPHVFIFIHYFLFLLI